MTPAANSLNNDLSIKFPAVYLSSSPEETYAYGKLLAPFLKEGSVVALYGPLGSGKTCLTKGIALELGVKEEITSPTYTIVSEYEGNINGNGTIPIYHIDAYRLRGDDDFSAIGGEEIIFAGGISIIEWSENIKGIIPEDAIKVEIKIMAENQRQIHCYRERE